MEASFLQERVETKGEGDHVITIKERQDVELSHEVKLGFFFSIPRDGQRQTRDVS